MHLAMKNNESLCNHGWMWHSTEDARSPQITWHRVCPNVMTTKLKLSTSALQTTATQHSVSAQTQPAAVQQQKVQFNIQVMRQNTGNGFQAHHSHCITPNIETNKMQCSEQSLSNILSNVSCRQWWLRKTESMAVHHRPPCVSQETWCLVMWVSGYWVSASAFDWYDHSVAECSLSLKTTHHTSLSTTTTVLLLFVLQQHPQLQQLQTCYMC